MDKFDRGTFKHFQISHEREQFVFRLYKFRLIAKLFIVIFNIIDDTTLILYMCACLCMRVCAKVFSRRQLLNNSYRVELLLCQVILLLGNITGPSCSHPTRIE